MLQFNTIGLLQAIASLALGSNTALSGAVAGLFTGSPILNRAMNISSITEANFQGYARQNITWGAVVNLASGGGALVANRIQFIANSGINAPQTITGGFIFNPLGGGVLIAAGLFDQAALVGSPGDSVNWNPAQEFGFDTNYGDLPGPNP